MAPRLELFAFRYRDPRTGKWIRARYRAERQEIAARYDEWEITGPAEIREVSSADRYFTPHERATPLCNLGPLLTTTVGCSRRVPKAGVAR